jgi:WXXGXW repeat (2 copies)
MKKTLLWKPVLAVVGGSLLMTGCVVRERVVYRPAPPVVAETPGAEVEVTSAPPSVPPADYVEVQPAIPGPDYIWVGGYWGWGPGGWVWTRGYWGRPPYRGAHWYGPHYVYRGGRHVWVRGGWR